MTAPIPITPLKAGPTGSARSGALAPFNDLTSGIDANFAATKTWATQVKNCLTLGTTSSSWLTPASGWTLLAGAYNVARRVGRLVQLQVALTYVGTITSSATGAVSPGLAYATITNVALRPTYDTQIVAQGFNGTGVAASLNIVAATGVITLNGMSATLAAVNPGFCFCITYFAPITSVVP